MDRLKQFRQNAIFVFSVLIFSFVMANIAGCSLPPDKYELEQRHKESKKPEKIDYEHDFKAYLDSVKRLISANNENSHQAVKEGNVTSVIELIQPFEWKSSGFDECALKDKRGLLLIHGLTDTPFLMRDIGNHFREKDCFLIRSILLPGHGTRPGDLLNVDYKDWKLATEFGVNSFRQGDVSGFYIAGFSTGGATALDYVLLAKEKSEKKDIKGLLLFSPAIKVADPKVMLANWHKYYSWSYPRGKWVDVAPDEDFAKYESFPKNAGDQVYLLTKEFNQLSAELTMPMFIALSNDDNTINSEATIKFFTTKLEASPQQASKLLLYRRPEENNIKECQREQIECRDSDLEAGVISFSHTALPVSSENFHYGKDAGYFNCIHYIKDKENKDATVEYNSCKEDSNVKSGEITEELRQTGPKVYRRLTYNPDFVYMMSQIDRFVKDTQKERQ